MNNKISIVVPMHNERENVLPLLSELSAVLRHLERPYEIIVVDDGSTDGTFEVLQKAAEGDSALRVLRLSRNFGQTAAVAAGIEHSTGDTIVTIDGDLENDPADIPRLLERLSEGYDLVSGWRQGRWSSAPLLRKVPSLIANRLISIIGGLRLHDYGCTLKVYRREVVREITLYGEMHRFIPLYVYREGAKISEMPVRHRPRRFGQSKYGITRTFRVILDLLFVKFLMGYMNKPIHFFGGLGLISLVAGFGAAAAAIVLKVIGLRTFVATPLPIFAALFTIVGVQLAVMGVIAEMVMRTYYESQDKRPYRIKEALNFGDANELRKLSRR